MASLTAPDVSAVAVISAYHPPADLVERAHDLLEQLDRIVIVDDGSHTAAELPFADERIETVTLPDNRGIAAALNVGVAHARAAGATHVLTLDQDSVVPAGYVELALAGLRAFQRAGTHVAAVVPAIVEGERITTIGTTPRPLDPIQSGQLLPISAFDIVGIFDERMVIDAVDSEFTLRARSRGYELYVVAGLELGHSLGEREPLLIRGRHLSILGRPRYWRYHAPFRTYYMVRNGLALWRMHRAGNARFLLRRTAFLAVDTMYTSLASPDRAAQFTAIGHALRDVVRRRSGRIPEVTLRAITRAGTGRR